MSRKRQKNQLALAFMAEARGEAPDPLQQGTERPTAERSPESPASEEMLMEVIGRRENILEALRRVKQNGGSPGVEGRTVQELPAYLRQHWVEIREQRLQGTYRPQPVRRVEIPKPGGGMRKLGIPTVLDRRIQQALLQVLQPQWDPTFSEQSVGFRPGRSAHHAVARPQQYLAQGYEIVVDRDLETCFDRVNHDGLRARVARRVNDKRLRRLIRAFLNAGVMGQGLTSPTDEGTPQGGPFSPLRLNLLLDERDRELERGGLHVVRYADDCNIDVRSQRAGQRVMESVRRFLTKRLRLKVNGQKSAVGRPQERKFLGFTLFLKKGAPRRAMAPKAIARFKERIRELTRRSQGISPRALMKRRAEYLKGWGEYYGFCQTPCVLQTLDAWVRRRLRCFRWKQWKRYKTRYRALRPCGIETTRAKTTASSSKGPWRLSHGQALDRALPKAYVASLGLPSLASLQKA